jgi:magnesium chelatase family protein
MRRRSLPRPHLRESSPCPSTISPRSSRTCAGKSTRRRTSRSRTRRRVVPDLADVRRSARRALEIAAAGRTTYSSWGRRGPSRRCSPGGSRASSRYPRPEALRSAHPLGVGAASARTERSCPSPPFRAPHHGSSAPAIVGGGSGTIPARCRSRIAACCFSTRSRFGSVLESLRQPLEDGVVAVARPEHALFGTLPARRDDQPLYPPTCCSPRSRWPSPPDPGINALHNEGRLAGLLLVGASPARARRGAHSRMWLSKR